jgi:hypothetical protein
MKAAIKKLRTFLTFDAPLEMEHITSLFTSTHSQYQQLIPDWGHTSTRQKLIANYWFSDVVAHFAAMISLPVLFLWLITSHFKVGYLAVVIIVVLFYFIITLFTTYWPSFVSNFLPKLETIMSTLRYLRHTRFCGLAGQTLSGYYHEKLRCDHSYRSFR